jgi:hypothetical protein
MTSQSPDTISRLRQYARPVAAMPLEDLDEGS